MSESRVKRDVWERYFHCFHCSAGNTIKNTWSLTLPSTVVQTRHQMFFQTR